MKRRARCALCGQIVGLTPHARAFHVATEGHQRALFVAHHRAMLHDLAHVARLLLPLHGNPGGFGNGPSPMADHTGTTTNHHQCAPQSASITCTPETANTGAPPRT
jgi:hypothetical protein